MAMSTTALGPGRVTQQTVERAREAVRVAGDRWTVARQLVVEVLVRAEGHLSVAQIHAAAAHYPAVNRSTVHRTVQTLTEHGVLHAVHAPGATLYSAVEQPHLHVICPRCGSLRELVYPAPEHEGAAAHLAAIAGLPSAEQATLVLYGQCERCQPG